MATSGGDLPRVPSGEDADWDAFVRKCARSAAYRHRVPDWAEDLTQEIHLRMIKAREAAERVNLLWIRQVASSIARNESRRRRKEAQTQRRVAAEATHSSRGIPKLCPGIARLVEPGRAGRILHRLILVSAVRVIKEVVGTKRGSGGRYMLFRAAYEDHETIESLAATFKKRAEAITEQLRRMSHAVERRLLAQLGLPSHVAAAIAARTADVGVVRESVRRTLEAFVVEERDGDAAMET